MSEPSVWICASALLAWSFAGAVMIEGRVHRFVVRQAGGRAGRGVAVVLACFAAGALLAVVVAVAGELLQRHGHSPAWVVVPAIAAYGPFGLVFLPTPYAGPGPTVRDLRKVGAPLGVARAIAWTAVPCSIVGVCLCFVGLAAAAAG